MGPIPGGRGPQSPLKFVVPGPPFADALGGHFIWPLTQVRIERVERIAQPNHYSPLFFGRTTTVAATPGQPFFIWQPAPWIADPDAITWRAEHSVHRFRTGYQTVGQSFALWGKYQQPAFDAEVIGAPKTDLFPYRQFAPAAVVSTQPFWIYGRQVNVAFDAETIKQPEHSLHRFRTTYQTVGQPWATWQAYKQPSFEPEKITPQTWELYPYRQITITAGPGQPWYLWPTIKITIDPEEKMYRENHDLSLYPFRPHNAALPPVESHGGGISRQYKLKPKYLRETFAIKQEQEFLALFQDRIDELAGIVRAPAATKLARSEQKTAEIKLLSNVNALAKSYSVELDSIDAARALIAERLADLADEEALAVILIAAHL